MTAGLAPIIEPGFFTSAPVHIGLAVGGIVAVASAAVGTFTIIRGQSFAGHALSDIGTAGGSAALLAGVPTLYGFVAMNLAAAGTMELIGIRRPRGRDLATGIVLGASLGLAALFLYLDTTHSNTTGATVNVLFGSIFTISASTVPVIAVLGGATVLVMTMLYRPLLLSSVSYELAAARGVPVRLVGIGYLAALAVAVSLSAVTIGAILSTALLIGPAAAALRLTKRTGLAIGLAAVIGVVATWLGILLAYDTAAWSAQGQGWPVSFCIVAVIFTFYLVVSLSTHRRGAAFSTRSAVGADLGH
jgi:zinc/manganese transport system permease protein